jgi:hypothetical protein
LKISALGNGHGLCPSAKGRHGVGVVGGVNEIGQNFIPVGFTKSSQTFSVGIVKISPVAKGGDDIGLTLGRYHRGIGYFGIPAPVKNTGGGAPIAVASVIQRAAIVMLTASSAATVPDTAIASAVMLIFAAAVATVVAISWALKLDAAQFPQIVVKQIKPSVVATAQSGNYAVLRISPQSSQGAERFTADMVATVQIDSVYNTIDSVCGEGMIGEGDSRNRRQGIVQDKISVYAAVHSNHSL